MEADLASLCRVDLTRPELAEVLTLDRGQGGLARLTVRTPHAEAELYLQGGHLTHWQPTGHEPALFLSRFSLFAPGEPIRGGIPLVFPWFGPHVNRQDVSNHGFLRRVPFTLTDARRGSDGSITLQLRHAYQPPEDAAWPHQAINSLSIHVSQSLGISWATQLAKGGPATFEQALHTYLRVGDVAATTLRGLEGTTYIDKVFGSPQEKQPNRPLTFEAETDRVFYHTSATCIVEDPELRRRLVLLKSGSRSTVVWNPWVDKASSMPDFGDDEWGGMLCVESGNIGPNAVTLHSPDDVHRLRLELSVEPM